MSMYAIGHVAICVPDLDVAVQFYLKLGLELSYQTPDIAYFYSGSQGLALVREGSEDAKPHFGFACHSRQDIEQRHEQLQRQGLTVTPIQTMGDAATFYGQDPAGNWFEYLYEPPLIPEKIQYVPVQKSKKPQGFAAQLKALSYSNRGASQDSGARPHVVFSP